MRDHRPALSRRQALASLVGGLGALTFPACRAAIVPGDPLACVARPAMTEGPYFVDEKLDRSDIRVDPSNGAVSPGALLHLSLQVNTLGSACAPLPGAVVDVWHCDAAGSYSDVGGAKGKRFLRGYQTTDAAGLVTFVTIVPGWYPGRTVHAHFKVRTPKGAAFTSQVFFDDTFLDGVYASAPYASRGAPDTRNADDGIFDGGGEQLLLTPTREGDAYVARLVLGLDAA